MALNDCLKKSVERGASEALLSQFHRLGSKSNEALSGLAGALERFLSPVVNAYAPDLVFEEALEKNQLVYVQLPTNLFKLQAPAVARAMLMDIQQAASMRQVFRRTRNQRPFSVVVDEFASFADRSIIESLNKLRDADLMFTLAHQSLADLELISKEFSQAVFDNCLTRDVLAQDNPDLCDKIAKSLGTYQHQERTVRVEAGPLFTEGMTGDASSRMVEPYRLQSNAIKCLPRCGQGYLLGAAQLGNCPLHWRDTNPTEGASPVC
jgi:type IV secretory pathway TraG/TraD family ATPase VirD4